ncbi:hypothetical protein WA158_004068 [Blastocystis sp. Blastoise]
MEILTCQRKGCSQIACFCCSKCLTACYCSANCQKEDWSNHKKVCKKLRLVNEGKLKPTDSLDSIFTKDKLDKVEENSDRITGVAVQTIEIAKSISKPELEPNPDYIESKVKNDNNSVDTTITQESEYGSSSLDVSSKSNISNQDIQNDHSSKTHNISSILHEDQKTNEKCISKSDESIDNNHIENKDTVSSSLNKNKRSLDGLEQNDTTVDGYVNKAPKIEGEELLHSSSPPLSTITPTSPPSPLSADTSFPIHTVPPTTLSTSTSLPPPVLCSPDHSRGTTTSLDTVLGTSIPITKPIDTYMNTKGNVTSSDNGSKNKLTDLSDMILPLCYKSYYGVKCRSAFRIRKAKKAACLDDIVSIINGLIDDMAKKGLIIDKITVVLPFQIQTTIATLYQAMGDSFGAHEVLNKSLFDSKSEWPNTGPEARFCTRCGTRKGKLVPHKKLSNIFMCESCSEFYTEDGWDKEEGADIYCRCCGDGGYITSCDICHHSLCERCKLLHYGETEISNTITNDPYQCVLCKQNENGNYDYLKPGVTLPL